MDVLIIGNSPISAQCRATLSTYGDCQIVQATSGYSGLSEARKQHFDAILVDFDLRDISGLQVALMLRHNTVIAITAENDVVVKRITARLSFHVSLAAPHAVDRLVNLIRAEGSQSIYQSSLEAAG